MAIAPNSTIKLLHQVPLSPEQVDTLWFATRTEQTFYFNSKVVRTFPLNTYQRSNKGVCRLNAVADELYDVNYMMFQNTNYSNRWFYAFVDGVDYVNDNACEVRYTLDPIQTWLLDYQTGACTIERETVADDEIGKHIEPENVELGTLVFNDYQKLDETMEDKRVILGIDPTKRLSQWIHWSSGVLDGIYSPVLLSAYDPYDSDDVDLLEDRLDDLAAVPDAVVMFYMIPAKMVSGLKGGEFINYDNTPSFTFNYFIDGMNETKTIDGYLPKNKKLYTHPYNFLYVENNAGQSMDLQYEFTDTPQKQMILNVTGNITYPVEINCMPRSYKGTGTLTNKSTKLSLKGYPMCAYNIDSYKAWVAQNSVPIALQVGAGALTLGLGALATGGASFAGVTAGAAVLNKTANLLAQDYKASRKADITNGAYETGNCDYAHNRMQFFYGRKSINKVFARRIDDFFTMYGYARGVVAIPNNHLRQRFTYVKTIGCNVYGTLPSNDAQYIAECYNNGIRFWVDHDRVGDYSIPNLPI